MTASEIVKKTKVKLNERRYVYNLHIDDDNLDTIDSLKSAQKISINKLINEIIRSWAKEYEREANEPAKQA